MALRIIGGIVLVAALYFISKRGSLHYKRTKSFAFGELFDNYYPYLMGGIIILSTSLADILLINDPSILLTKIPALVLLAITLIAFDWFALLLAVAAVIGLNFLLKSKGELIFDFYPLLLAAGFFTLFELKKRFFRNPPEDKRLQK
ncbi:MAG: hypothetical protein Kow0090_04260 [Myxococcota bacterium]